MQSAQRGFTLVEVLVAMLVLGTAVATVLSLLTVQTSNAVRLRDGALARVAAENALVEVVLADQQAGVEEEGGEIVLGERVYLYTVDRATAPGFETLELVTVDVAQDGGTAARASLSTLVPVN